MVNVLVPWVEPKLVPVIVTVFPAAAEAGEMPLIAGVGSNAKDPVLLATPFTVTTTLPFSAVGGTSAPMLVAAQLVAVTDTAPMVNVLVPWVEPKFVPVIVTEAATAAELGETPLIAGVASNVKDPVLATPFTVTTTLPLGAADGTSAPMLVAAQVVAVTDTPPMVSVLLPCVEPKFVPVIVTEAPAAALLGVTDTVVGPVIVVESMPFAVADPPPDTLTEFTCGELALAPTFTVTVIAG